MATAKKARKNRAAAIVTIRDAGRMNPEGRKAVAEWLRMHAKMLLKDGGDYPPVFTGRHMGW